MCVSLMTTPPTVSTRQYSLVPVLITANQLIWSEDAPNWSTPVCHSALMVCSLVLWVGAKSFSWFYLLTAVHHSLLLFASAGWHCVAFHIRTAISTQTYVSVCLCLCVFVYSLECFPDSNPSRIPASLCPCPLSSFPWHLSPSKWLDLAVDTVVEVTVREALSHGGQVIGHVRGDFRHVCDFYHIPFFFTAGMLSNLSHG